MPQYRSLRFVDEVENQALEGSAGHTLYYINRHSHTDRDVVVTGFRYLEYLRASQSILHTFLHHPTTCNYHPESASHDISERQ